MMKEERKLRDIIKDLDTDHSCCPTCGTDTERHSKGCRWGEISPAITALVRAVREDNADTADQMALYTGVDVAAAIRAKK